MDKFASPYQNPDVKITAYFKENEITGLCSVTVNLATGTTLCLGGRRH